VFAIEDARFVEQEMHRVVLEGEGVGVQFGERDDQLVTGVHLQDLLRGEAPPALPRIYHQEREPVDACAGCSFSSSASSVLAVNLPR
jgi:hypothetical protein